MKLCIDCKFFEPEYFLFLFPMPAKFAKCGKSVNPVDYLVDGVSKAYCTTNRMDFKYREVCGPEGKWFEEKK